MIIAVDFDGTICEDNFPEIGAPKWDVIRGLQAIQDHVTLILWTCRINERLHEAVKWCEEHGLHFDKVNENATHNVEQYGTDPRKVFADIYIDDKAFSCSQAEDFLKLVQTAIENKEENDDGR